MRLLKWSFSASLTHLILPLNNFRRVISLTKEKKLQIALIIILSVVGFVKVSNENHRKKSKMNIVRS